MSTEIVSPVDPSTGLPLVDEAYGEKLDFPTEEEIEAILPKVELVADDGENMESEIHRMTMDFLIASIRHHFLGRKDYYTGGNSFIYYSLEQARNLDFKGPDFFFIKDVPFDPPRPYWCVWEEGGRYPNVIIELLSTTTRKNDLTIKKDVYEKIFHTGNYFCFDPHSFEFIGWALERNGYVELKPNEKGWLWSDELNLWVGPVEGTWNGYRRKWLRFFTPDGQVIRVHSEVAEQKAEEAQRRAEAAEAELAKLKALQGRISG